MDPAPFATNLDEALERLETALAAAGSSPDAVRLLGYIQQARAPGTDDERRSSLCDKACQHLIDHRDLLVLAQTQVPFSFTYLRRGAGENWNHLTALAMHVLRAMARGRSKLVIGTMAVRDNKVWVADSLWYALQNVCDASIECRWPDDSEDPACTGLGGGESVRWRFWQRAAITALGGDPDDPPAWVSSPARLLSHPAHALSRQAVLETNGGGAFLSEVVAMEAEFPSTVSVRPVLSWVEQPKPTPDQMRAWANEPLAPLQPIQIITATSLAPMPFDPGWYRRLAYRFAPDRDPAAAIVDLIHRHLIGLMADQWSVMAPGDPPWLELAGHPDDPNLAAPVFLADDLSSLVIPVREVASILPPLEAATGCLHLLFGDNYLSAHAFLRNGGFLLLDRAGVRFLMPDDGELDLDRILVQFGSQTATPPNAVHVDRAVVGAAVDRRPSPAESGGDGFDYLIATDADS